ncbi:nicotinate (nicotinamide) nucleotide adenylyltransferase [Sinomicrobium weinanense]|uniref:Probable nicotinate-nucleotide adenylyltransferase n=1 Tax=Sinomicrobium weinanense TaxID=2842200 RepID=A0A926JNJ9_9FLAO|nr:nicotinate (nicotinamide) nucleotide adenylyltransferase [Sinomicrobium weinanense]MBC9794494.1 nicotinate-nucleotide adenylyltransferase [Sinomicrobium weinanense]MBU3124401.1 nicotinate-nucleotide adenylyltransferase [Sinomicrobium weinanense]
MNSRKKTGLYFGTFNPVHVGHIIIANHFAEHSDLDEIWLVVTPHNPFKKKSSLLPDHHRLEMVHRATEKYNDLKPCDIEFKLPQPSYTVNTLAHLQEKYPQREFCLIMGEDNLNGLHKWKNYEIILEHHSIYVYPRITSTREVPLEKHPRIHKIDAPIIEISSTAIRKDIKAGKNVSPLLDPSVWQYIDQMNFYK